MLDDQQHLIPLASGGVLRVKARTALGALLTGGAELSIWERDADVTVDVLYVLRNSMGTCNARGRDKCAAPRWARVSASV